MSLRRLPMPVDLPPSKVYRDQMSALSHGLALWNPNPPKEIYDKVSIGDVGYLHEGTFIRIFNVTLPWDHPSNRLVGTPEPYDPLDCGPFTNTIGAHFGKVDHYSRFVTAETNAGNSQAMSLDEMESVTYKFRNRGALLSLPNGGHSEDAIRMKAFEDYIRDHVDSWFNWAQNNKLGVERMEDLILVSGCTLVTSWAAAAFVDNTSEAEISLTSRRLSDVGASFVLGNVRGRVSYHNSRFDPDCPTIADQCVFIRGFRVKRVLSRIRPIRIGSGRDDEDPQRSPYRHATYQRNDSLRNTSLIGGSSSSLDTMIGPGDSSSSLDTIGPPINHENPQLLPYPSSTTLQNNGSLCDASFMTSPSYDSFIEDPNDIAEVCLPGHDQTKSAPQPPQSLISSSPHHPTRPTRARSVIQYKRSRCDAIPASPEHAKSGVRAQTMSYPKRRSLNSTVKQVLTESPQFRILVVGKRGSGKSSLINATFRVNMAAALGRGSDINLAFRPEDNHRLIVHEYSGLEPGDAHGLRTVRDFIANRTDPHRAPAERLNAIWICIPTSDATGGSIGEGVDEILNMRRVPVIVVFTKSDLNYPHISGSESGNYQYRDRTRTKAYSQCNELCRSLFRRDSRDVPAELVSVMPQYSALINNLTVTTDRFIMGSRAAPSSWSSSQGAKSRISLAPLTWSVALRASQDITIQASIEIGRSRYWRNLWSSLDFTDQTLEDCVNVIHIDIVEIWNLYDRRRYLTSNRFKINMSHVVKDLATPAGCAPPSDRNVSGDKFADWVYDVYRGSQENVRCMMGYIVNLTVILDDIFKTTSGSVTGNAAREVMDNHVRSGRRDSIHRDIRSFVAETFSIRLATQEKDLVLENIVSLIRQYCSPPNT